MRLQALYNKCLSQEASTEEKAELLELLEDARNAEMVKTYIDELLATEKPLMDVSPQTIESILAAIVSARPIAHRVHFLRTPWFRYAAAVVLLIGAGLYLFLTLQRYPSGMTGPIVNNREERAPITNNNKAILTLASGQKIELDGNQFNYNRDKTKLIPLLEKEGSHFDPSEAGQNAGVASPNINTITTPRGTQYQVILPDGTKAWLNAESSIKFPTPFTGKQRKVETTGEIYFEVSVNKMAPFVVSTKGMEVEVLGTSFNMNAYEDEEFTKTTLVDGSVRISSGSAHIPSFRRSGATEKSPNAQRFLADARNDDADALNDVILKPGQAYTNGKVVAADIEQDLAWKSGLFRFKDANINEIMRQLIRWYDVDVVYQSNNINDHFVVTIPRNLSLSQTLEILEQTGRVKFELQGRKLIVSAP